MEGLNPYILKLKQIDEENNLVVLERGEIDLKSFVQ